MGETYAFFYGTLMHPKILERVIKNDGSHLAVCPAALMDHTRHKVKNEDYPGLIPYVQGRTLCNRELSPEEKSVRGTLVKGLTEKDMKLLDFFEGPEYIRKGVDVHPLGPMIKLSEYGSDKESLIPSIPPPLPIAIDNSPIIHAETYIYDQFRNLDAELWSFETFVKNNARKWYGGERDDDDNGTEVGRRRAELEGEAALAKFLEESARA
ncbi:hypothetical protein BDZ94DRAFT_1247062 [Collybia nuda]|uniref:Putative gamma-glutamylcyclotransferase n=1 Tax=Collybia nuda TaxID=64659 RepID=A0A9P6CIV8_9AGAR|nr:hypothetical protein BDZ94DRAFT_1247062 [Collybia nuda]